MCVCACVIVRVSVCLCVCVYPSSQVVLIEWPELNMVPDTPPGGSRSTVIGMWRGTCVVQAGINI